MRTRRLLTGAGKAGLALVSVAALTATAAGWYTYQRAAQDLATDNVITDEAGQPVLPKPPGTDTNILLVGVDSRTDAQGRPLSREVLDALQAGEAGGEQNTDTMMLVHVPADPTKKAFAVSLPRDSYVDIAGGFGKHKLNSAYARAKVAAAKTARGQGKDNATVEKESVTAGRKNLITTVAKLTGLTVDHYAEINLYGFSEITKAVGGIPVCLNKPVRDDFSGANFPAGQQVLEGVDALKFVRQRHGLPAGDLDRVRRQQAFLAGLANRVLSAGTLTDPGKVQGLVDALTRSVVLDQGWDLLGFAAQVQGLTGGRIQFQTIPTLRANLATPGDGVAVEVDPAKVKAFVQNLLTGDATPPVAAGGGSAGGAPVGRVKPVANTNSAQQPLDASGIPCVN
ncbi:LCP family protein required for cell wall assembly [Crossiella equi]|uniref:LCP family protein required for cell wall assembly n=2 Tax=Crossiella equi TaxID=130796 RepID=A0ABS5A3W1_9PSEU|nr:LCP family protein [Crossiella equi]MBP2471255.1 LCP family protein required for cell wall assembly [Crossiella equi]